MTDPQDAIPDPVRSSDYWTGYYEGKRVAGDEATQWIIHQSTLRRRPLIPKKWITAGFWACVLLVGVSHLIAHLSHDYSRVDAFEDGVILMVLIGRLSRPRYPR